MTDDEELLARCEEGKRGTELSRKNRRLFFQKFIREVGGARGSYEGDVLRTANQREIELWLGRLASQNTIHTQLMTLQGFYLWAYREEVRDDIPTLRIKYIAPSKTRGDAVSEKDLETALESAAHEPVILAWFRLAAYAGCGPKEIAFMNRADVHDQAEPPFLTARGRGDRERVVTGLDRRVVSAVQDVEEWWVGLTPQQVSVTANRFLHDRSQLEHVSINQLRNRFIVETLAVNEDVFEAQRQIGHADPKSTLIYSRQETPARGAVRHELR